MPSLCSMLLHVTSLGSPRDPSGFTRNLGTTKRLRPLAPVGASGVRARTAWTMLGVRSWSPLVMKIFVAADAVGPVLLLHGLGLDVAQVAAGARLREAHGARPLAGVHLLAVDLLQLIGGEALDEVRGAAREEHGEADGGVGPHDELADARAHGLGQPHAAEFGGHGGADPTARGQVLVGLVEARRQGDLARLELGPDAVSRLVAGGHAALG